MSRDYDDGYGATSIFFAFLLGGIVGAGISLLMAPQSGEETRQKIHDLADDVRERAEGYYDQAREQVSSNIQRGKDYVDEKKSLLTSAVDAGKEAYQREKERQSDEA